MDKFDTHYEVIGSSALKPSHGERIIEFPDQRNDLLIDGGRHRRPQHRIGSALATKVMQTDIAQNLVYGSIQGKPFHKAKPWQTVLACACFFALAVTCIYIGR